MTLLEPYKPLGMLAAVLAIGALLAGFAAGSTLAWLSLALALFLYSFLPGYTILLHLELDAVERSIFAFPVGVMAVSLGLYFLNVFGVALTRITVLAVIVVVTAASLVLLHRKKMHHATSSAQ